MISFYVSVHHGNDLGSPVPRKNIPLKTHQPSSTSTSSTFMSNLPTFMSNKSTTSPFPSKTAASTPLPANRDRVAFGIKPKQSLKPQETSKEEKPRIVMQIKNGKVTTYEKSPNGKSKIVNGGSSSSKLVPYDGESDSEEESNQSKSKVSADKVAVQLDKLNVENESRTSAPKHKMEGAVIFDEKLNATTSVPGNTKLLESSLKDDRVNGGLKMKHSGHPPSLKSKDLTPDRKSTFENSSLTCITSTKINATSSSWHVLYQDSILSPSRGSNSSKESTNSTTEWQLKDPSPFTKVPERQHPGWKVLEDEKRKATSGIKNNRSNATTTSPSQPNLEKDKVHKTVIDVNPQPHSEKDKVYKTILDICDQNHYSSYDSVDVSDKQNLISPESNEKHKKHKKKKHKHGKDHDDEDVKYQELDNENNLETTSKKHKKKKRKHKKEREHEEDKKLKRHREEDGYKQHRKEESHSIVKKRKLDTESDDSAELVWVEKTKDSVVTASTQDRNGKSYIYILKINIHNLYSKKGSRTLASLTIAPHPPFFLFHFYFIIPSPTKLRRDIVTLPSVLL